MKKSLLVFAGTAVGLVCGAFLISLVSSSVAQYAMYAGAVCYLLFSTTLASRAVARARLGWRKTTLRIAGAVCVYTIAAVVLSEFANEGRVVAAAVRWDPQGEPSDSSMFAYPCTIRNLESVTNAKGDIADARFGDCGWGPFAGMSYGYIVVGITRSRGTQKTREVVFRYEPMLPDRWTWPKMKWVSDDILSVAVGNNAINQISKQRFDLEGLHVRYSLGPAKKPPMTIWDLL